jgi:beta-lactamase class D
MRRFLPLLIFAAFCVPAPPAMAWPALPLGPIEVVVDSEFAKGNDTVAYLEDLETGQFYGVQGGRCEERHPPFSSFKIPNFLIALETDVIAGEDAVLPYDSGRRPREPFWPDDWAQDQTLRSAFQRSAAWAFQDLALQIGEQKYAGYLEHFSYGNRQAKGDGFWLDRSLQVSPKEQVDFLRRLLSDQLEISPLHIDSLKRAALAKESDGFKLFAKTGAGPVRSGDFDGEFEGWLVGWLERPNAGPVLFALWTRGTSFQAIKSYRMAATIELLEQTGFLPLNW